MSNEASKRASAKQSQSAPPPGVAAARGRLYKQSQFRRCVQEWGCAGLAGAALGTIRATSPRCPASGNKPNSHPARGIGGASRDPKRASSRLGARSTLRVGTIAPNKPNLQADRATSPRCPASGNKANSRAARTGRGKDHSLRLEEVRDAHPTLPSVLRPASRRLRKRAEVGRLVLWMSGLEVRVTK